MSMKPNVKYTPPIIKQIKAESQKETRTEDRTTKEWTLWTACSDGELEKVQSMMKPLKDDKEFDINWCDPELKRTSLYRACGIGGKLEVVKLLLDNFPNIDLNKPNSEGGSPLFIACQSNHVEIAKLLLSLKGVNPNQPIHDGETCLTAACANGKEEIVSLLLSRPDIDPNVSKKNGTTPLWFAAQHGKLNIVKSLFASPKEIKTTIISNWNSTLPKVWAKMRGFTEIAALIEEYERDPKKVRESIWREKKLYVQTFVHGILFADGYYRLKSSSAEEQEEEAKAKRYFQIVSKLPIEIQMMIAHKSMGSNGIFVLSHNTEATLRDILIGS